MTNNVRDARTFVALQFQLAAKEADMTEPSAEMKRRMAALGASIRRREAQRRYAENALWPVEVISGDIRPEIAFILDRVEQCAPSASHHAFACELVEGLAEGRHIECARAGMYEDLNWRVQRIMKGREGVTALVPRPKLKFVR